MKNELQQLIKLDTVKTMTTFSKSSIYSGVKAKTFPAPVRLGSGAQSRAVAWKKADIIAWIESRTATQANERLEV